MRMNMRERLAFGVLFLLVLFWIWYSVAANYDYAVLAGTYVFHGDGESCTLYLRSDRTFMQEVKRSTGIQKSQGYWYRSGEAGVSFSNEFLKLSDEEMDASGQAYGQFEKTLGLFPALVLAPLSTGPRLHKKLFS